MDYLQQHIKPYNEDSKKTEQVEHMFDNIVYAYDELNHTLSSGMGRNWRRKAIAWLRPLRPQHTMDVAAGTGDFVVPACRELNPDELIEADISEGMMDTGRGKVEKEGFSDKISFAREDCTSLSFVDNRFDAITVTFGVRNFEDLDKGLSEACRVLRPGGHLVILGLTTPDRFPMKQLLAAYLKVVIPLLGKLLSKDDSTYHYLSDAIEVFLQREAMKGVIPRTGFGEIHLRRLTFGICTLYTTIK